MTADDGRVSSLRRPSVSSSDTILLYFFFVTPSSSRFRSGQASSTQTVAAVSCLCASSTKRRFKDNKPARRRVSCIIDIKSSVLYATRPRLNLSLMFCGGWTKVALVGAPLPSRRLVAPMRARLFTWICGRQSQHVQIIPSKTRRDIRQDASILRCVMHASRSRLSASLFSPRRTIYPETRKSIPRQSRFIELSDTVTSSRVSLS